MSNVSSAKDQSQILQLLNPQHPRKKEGQFPVVTGSASIVFPHCGSKKVKKEKKGGKEEKREERRGREGRKKEKRKESKKGRKEKQRKQKKLQDCMYLFLRTFGFFSLVRSYSTAIPCLSLSDHLSVNTQSFNYVSLGLRVEAWSPGMLLSNGPNTW